MGPDAQPTAAYLQQLIRAMIGDETVPLSIRNECHRLMMAIDRNDQSLIIESVARIEKLAVDADVALPPHASTASAAARQSTRRRPAP